MIDISQKTHKGVILDASNGRFDNYAATFATIFADTDDQDAIYLFYTGAKDTRWSSTGIGLALSNDGENFRKIDESNPLIESKENSFCSKEIFNCAVARVKNHFYMILSGQSSLWGRRIGIAFADDPRGPWKIIGELIRPKEHWEGNDIDIGPRILKTNESELIIYYSNVSNKWRSRLLFGPHYLLRKIGILKLKVTSPSGIEAHRYNGNPLKHLNGPKGSWNESLFCPGHLQIQDSHYLFPSASTYSAGFPYKQYIGMITGATPYFEKPQQIDVLIDGPAEKKEIVPAIRSEIALDTPCPFVRKNTLYLYYAVMDRSDHIWKTALTTYQID